LEGENVHVQYNRPAHPSKHTAYLEPNHHFFIFVDDGTQGVYGGEITFRAKLEQELSGMSRLERMLDDNIISEQARSIPHSLSKKTGVP
jgi:hypothetical protein